MYIILNTFGVALALKFLFTLLSMVEKQLICRPTIRFDVIEARSLRVFKKVRNLLCLAAGIESAYFNGWPPPLTASIIGIFLIVLGMLLRTSAILSLGQYWNYNIVTFTGNKRIRSGVYKHIRHPAYIGNMYIVGVFLSTGAISVALISLMLVFGFYLYRSRIEDRILKCL